MGLLALGQWAVSQVRADFSFTLDSKCPPAQVEFTNLSTGNNLTYRWDLGNGAKPINRDPKDIYINPGTYNVKLVVSDGVTSDSITKQVVVDPLPVVDFSASLTEGCFPLRTQITDRSTANSGNIVTWEWDFGDGTQSTQQNPFHVFREDGNFNVTLRIVTSTGCQAIATKNQFIRIPDGVLPAFTNNSPINCKPPADIQFFNQSTGPGNLSYNWLFGDGGTSTAQEPQHQYLTPGRFNVSLVVTSSEGCFDTLTKVQDVTVENTRNDFTTGATCAGEFIEFRNLSTPAPQSVRWDMGDGTIYPFNNPFHRYANPGTYNVKLVNDFGVCLDSITKPIVVGSKPDAAFTGRDTVSCRAPLTTTFQDQTAGAVEWIWDFGDGNSSTLQNPQHTYTNPGIYNVRLIVKNATGCMDTLLQRGFVKIQTPVIAFTNLPDSGCIPYTVRPLAIVNSPTPVTGYLWNFGDGTTSTEQNPSHDYTVSGYYDVSLTVTTSDGCTSTFLYDTAVKVGTPITPDFTYTPNATICASQAVTFTNLTTGADSYVWDFGDGSESFERDPIHIYRDTGFMQIKLTAFNIGCGTEVVKSDLLRILGPISNFGYQVDCADPRIVTFSDSSIGAITYRWDFGDGTTLDGPSTPTHTFPARGVYNVELTTSDGNCTYSYTREIRADIETPDFELSSAAVCKNEDVVLTVVNSDSLNIIRYQWRFPNGDTLGTTVRSVLTSFPIGGDNNVRLLIYDVNGCTDSIVKPIRINGPRPNFGVQDPAVCKGLSVTFIDSTESDGVNPVVRRIWVWGDGTREEINNPPYTHSYATAGVYSVRLVTIDASGCADSIFKFNVITVSNVRADFASPDTFNCSRGSVRFNNQSVGNFGTYLWEFGDGNTSASRNPVHQYAAPGLYSVKLMVTDLLGCSDTTERINYISVNDPVAAFSVDDSVASCPPLNVKFTFEGQYFTNFLWDFGDGVTVTSRQDPDHFYANPGVYNARLIVTSPGGCTDTASKIITIYGPTGILNADVTEGCVPLTVNFTFDSDATITKYKWAFGDGTLDSTLAGGNTYTYTYTYQSIFPPILVIRDETGCEVPIRGPIITAYDASADFTSDTRVVCESGFIQFRDSTLSNDNITGYLWNFGDGTTSTQKDPRHFYSTYGLYDVSLIVTTRSGCTDTIVKPAYIKVVNRPNIDIAGAAFEACEPATLTFQGVEIVPDTSRLTWRWDMGNGNVYTIQNPPTQNYPNDGNYTLTAIATNSSGCPDTATRIITIHPLPDTYIRTDTTLCLGDTLQLLATGALNYQWLQPSGNISCTDCPNPLVWPEFQTTYIVRGITAFGCETTDTLIIDVKRPFEMTLSDNDTLCIGQSVRLRASGAENYLWTPANGLSSVTSATPIANPTTTTTYYVTGYDDFNCFSVTDSIQIAVYPYPTVEAGPDQTILAGYPAQIRSNVSSDVTTIRWTPFETLSCPDCAEPVATPKKTTTYEILVTNEGGCEAEDQLTIFVICNNTNLYMANTFTPNGDGVNDWFFPQGRGINSIQSMRVYNRWGQLVFERRNFSANAPTQGWNGTVNGQRASTDIYVYVVDVICDNGQVFQFKGNVMVAN